MNKKTDGSKEGTNDAAQRIDARIKELGDWRGETLAKVRSIIKEADPEVVEEVKWAKRRSCMVPQRDSLHGRNLQG
jgi:hypothetical protein